MKPLNFFSKPLLFIVILVSSVSAANATIFYSKSGATVANATTSWTTNNTGGSGTAPSNFTSTTNIFIVRTGQTLTTNTSLWTMNSILQINGTLVLNNSATKTFTGDITVNSGGTLQITSSSVVINAADLTVSAGSTFRHYSNYNNLSTLLTLTGDLSIDGTYDYTGYLPAIQMNGTGTHYINTGSTSVNSLLLRTANYYANGNVTVDSLFYAMWNQTGGSFHTNDQTVKANWGVVISGGTLYVDGGDLTVGSTIGGILIGRTMTMDGDLQVSSGTVNISGGGIYLGTPSLATPKGTCTQSGGTINIAVLDVGHNSTFTQSGGINNVNGALNLNYSTSKYSQTTGTPTLNIAGNLTNNGILSTGTGTDVINIAGNWINNLTFTTSSTNTITFNGTGAQDIGGTVASTFNNLIINNPGIVSISKDQTVNNLLTLTSGKLNIGSNNLIFGSSATAVAGGPFSATNMIVADGTGEVRKNISAVGSYFFPIGDNTGIAEYSPVTLNVTSGTFAAGAYTGVKLSNLKHPNNASSADFLRRYWTVSNSGITSPSFNVSANFLTADVAGAEANIAAAKYTGALPWIKYGVISSNTLSATGITNTGANIVFSGISNPAPTVTISGGKTICPGGSAQLSSTVSNGTTSLSYAWTPVTGLSSSTIANPVSSPSVNTTYTLTVTDGNGFTGSSNSTTVTIGAVPAAPTVTPGGTTSLCTGGSVTLTSSAGNSYLWSNGATTQSINVSTAGSYTLQVTNATGCVSAASVPLVVTVTAPPATPTITGGPTTFCAGGSVTLTSSAGNSYLWSTGATTQSIVVSTAGSYTVKVTNAGGCESASSAATTVTVNARPTGVISGTQTICKGNTATLTLTVTGTGSISGTLSNGAAFSGTAPKITVNVSPAITTAYTVATLTNGTCTSTAPDISGTATVTISSEIANNQLNYINGANGTICATPNENGTAVLTAPSGTVFTTVNFASYGTPGGSCGSFVVNSSCHAAGSRSIVEGYMLGNNAASIPATNVVFTDPCVGTVKSLFVQAAYTKPVCSGSSPGTITGTTPTGGTGTYTYLWEMSTTGASGPFIPAAGTNNAKDYAAPVLTQTTWYRRTVSAVCSNLSPVIIVPVISVPAKPVVSITQPSCTVAKGTINVTSPTGLNYSTNGSDYTNTTGSFANLNAGSYSLTAMNSNGCISPATSVTINSQPVTPATPVASNNSPVCVGSTLTLSATTIANVTYSWTGPNGFSSALQNPPMLYTTAAAGVYTVKVISAGGCSSATSSTTISSATTPGLWTGNLNSDWNTAQNWCNGVVPTTSTPVTIPVTLNKPLISSATASAQHINIAAGVMVTVVGQKLQISGDITGSGVIDSRHGTIEMNGSSGQSISGSLFSDHMVQDLLVNNTGSGLSVSAAQNDTLKISGSLSFGNANSKILTGDNITLLSSDTATAGVGIVGPSNSITGKVVVERYINTGTTGTQHPKSWQFLAISTTGQTIKESWMEDNVPAANLRPGYGTQITGNAGTSAGFDMATPSPSMKYYNNATGAWTGITSISNSIYDPKGYMVFVRGDRSVNGTTVKTATPTILRTKGNLITGTMPPVTLAKNKYTSVGNPYASAIDFSLIAKDAGVDDVFYAWDEYLFGSYGLGGYQTVSSVNNWEPVPGGTRLYPTGKVAKIIRSGQAFLVHVTEVPVNPASTHTLTIAENCKVSGVAASGIGREHGNNSSAKKQFFSANILTGSLMADGNMMAFDKSFSNDIDNNDAKKLSNSGENFGIKSGGDILAIEARKSVEISDTIHYNMSNLKQQIYQLQFIPKNMESSGISAFLIDRFLNTFAPVSLSDTTLISFAVTAAPASFAPDRFKVVFKIMSVLPVTISSITAQEKNSVIEINWKVANESGMQQYEVEKSTDGNNFKQIGILAAGNRGSDTYSWPDKEPSAGYNYYRVRTISNSGETKYTQIVKVLKSSLAAEISVYPNPVVNQKINLQLTNQPAGDYGVRLINNLGQIVHSSKITRAQGSSVEIIEPGNRFVKGIYQLEVTMPAGEVKVIKVIN